MKIGGTPLNCKQCGQPSSEEVCYKCRSGNTEISEKAKEAFVRINNIYKNEGCSNNNRKRWVCDIIQSALTSATERLTQLASLRTEQRNQARAACAVKDEALKEALSKWTFHQPESTRRKVESALDSDCGKELLAELQRLREALRLIIPMAKGYAHKNPVGNNWKFIEEAEKNLAAREAIDNARTHEKD
jgi:hypothetical protein